MVRPASGLQGTGDWLAVSFVAKRRDQCVYGKPQCTAAKTRALSRETDEPQNDGLPKHGFVPARNQPN